MSSYSNYISQSDALALIPEEVSAEIIKAVPQQSAVLRLGRRLKDMSSRQYRMPVMSALATAYFVSGSDYAAGERLKKTTSLAWDDKYITAEELAVIVPIPEDVIADETYDIWGEVRPSVEEAIGLAVDQAVLFSTDAPATWPTAIVPGAIAAGHVAALPDFADLYEAILTHAADDTPGMLMLIEEDGYQPSAYLGHISMRGRLRNTRDTLGQPIFSSNMQDGQSYQLDGAPCVFPMNGCMDPDEALLIGGDWTQLVYAFRQDISFKMLDQAVIQDADGNIVLNLAQQDMVAMRVVVRMGWQLPNPINRMQSDEDLRYPFSILTAEAGS